MTTILETKNLTTTFKTSRGNIDIIKNISINLEKGETLGIVGESGSGKSILMKSIMDILPEGGFISSGEIYFKGDQIDNLGKKQLNKIKGNSISMVFQDPMSSLNPVKTIGFHLMEVLNRHSNNSYNENKKIVLETLESVGIKFPELRFKQYPFEFSGGMRQRALIAMALCCSPDILIADEPTTALDVTIQAQILTLLKKIQLEKNMSIALITHDLGIVASLCTKVIVMYGGQIMEEGLIDEIFYETSHPYTNALIKAIPKMDKSSELYSIPGFAISPYKKVTGCPFAPRCEIATEKCFEQEPGFVKISDTHSSKCFYA